MSPWYNLSTKQRRELYKMYLGIDPSMSYSQMQGDFDGYVQSFDDGGESRVRRSRLKEYEQTRLVENVPEADNRKPLIDTGVNTDGYYVNTRKRDERVDVGYTEDSLYRQYDHYLQFAKEGKTVDDQGTRQWLSDWYTNEETLKRIQKHTGGIPEEYTRGMFILENTPVNKTGWFDRNSFNPITREVKVDKDVQPEIIMHELNHGLQRLQNELFNVPDIKEGVPSMDRYYSNPTEIHSRLMEIRYILNKKPGEEITEDEYNDALERLGKDRKKELNKNYNKDKMIHWLNTVASVSNNKQNLYA